MSSVKDLTMSIDDFTNGTAHFLKWLTDVAGVKICGKLEIKDCRNINQGRCIFAKQDILEGETLFEIPRSSLLNISTSKLIDDFSNLKDKLYDHISHWEGLIICMLYEISVLKDRSFWWPYFEVLPGKDDMNSLIFWTDNELSFLEPSLVLERIGLENAKKMYKQVQDLILELVIPISDLTWERFLVTATIIMSYSFDVQNYEENNSDDDDGEDDNEIVIQEEESTVRKDNCLKSMVPLADTLNSDTSKCNANLMHEENSLRMEAIKDIKTGDQIYNIYGDHPNAEILRRYGYVEANGSKFDFAELPLSLMKDVINEEFVHCSDEMLLKILLNLQENDSIQTILEYENIVSDSFECYNDGEVPNECILLLQILVTFLQIDKVNKLKGENFSSMLERVTKKSLQLIQMGKITEKTQTIWRMMIAKRISQYPSMNDEVVDIEKLSTCKDKHELRKTLARVVLKGELEALHACTELKFSTIKDSKLLNNVQKSKDMAESTKPERKRRRKD